MHFGIRPTCIPSCGFPQKITSVLGIVAKAVRANKSHAQVSIMSILALRVQDGEGWVIYMSRSMRTEMFLIWVTTEFPTVSTGKVLGKYWCN